MESRIGDGEAFCSILDSWLIRCRVALVAYNDATNVTLATERRIGIPASILSAIVATSVFSSLGSDPAIEWRIVTGVLALLSSGLAALHTFLRPSEKAEQYREASRQYGSLRRRLEQASAFPPTDTAEKQKLLSELAIALDEAARAHPNVSPIVRELAELKVRGTSRAKGLTALRVWLRQRVTINVTDRP